jgi:putative hemolysin
MDGLLPIDELEKLLGIEEIPGSDEGRYQSLGGFLFLQLGRVPTAGDTLEWSGWRFEIVDMDGRRIDKVLAAPLAETAAPGEGSRVSASSYRSDITVGR